MCGIVGVVHLDGAPVGQDLLQAMTRALAHRGPDGEGVKAEGSIGLGHRRLAILDPSPAGAQPMTGPDGQSVLTYNGEIYNFKELRAELAGQGHVFQSKTDTEVVLAAYRQWGDGCVSRFNGMFALAVWDRFRQRIFLARDRYGIKPLYTWQTEACFVFASEIKAFLQHPRFCATLNPAVLLEYFTFQNVFTDRTLFSDVSLLPPGHTAILDLRTGSVKRHRYWDYDFFGDDVHADERQLVEELHRLFEQAVKRQLVSDVPVGAYLSGGIDSGAITAVAARAIPYLESFTCGFDLTSASGLEMGSDERERAEALSSRFKTEHYEVVLKAGDMERVLPDLVWHLEDLRVGQCYPLYYTSRLAGKFVKVVLGGTGGDELFAGYPWRYYRTVHSLDVEEYVQRYYRYWQRLVGNKVIHGLFQPDVWDQVKATWTVDIFRDVMRDLPPQLAGPEDAVKRSLYFECKTFLHGLLLVEDRLSMAHGLESRVPFLDNDLVDFATRLPVRVLLRDLNEIAYFDENEFRDKQKLYFERTSDGKQILRKMLIRYLSECYVGGPKQGFSPPDAGWFRGDSMDYVRDLLFDNGARIYQYLRPDTVQGLVTQHLQGQKNRRLLIWSLLCFEWWCRQFLDGGR